MTEIIKQRLVGMLIVVIAGVVFLPDLLDGQKQLTKEEFKKVPAKPEFDEQPILTEFPAQKVADALAQAPVNEQIADDADNEAAKPNTSPDNQQAKPVAPNNSDKTASEANSKVVVNTLTTDNTVATTNNETAVTPQPIAIKEPAWILQLGSFKHKENVNSLREKLLNAGFKTFTKPVKTKSGILSKVYLGPELDKAKLVQAQAKLKELVGLEGKITRYDPTR